MIFVGLLCRSARVRSTHLTSEFKDLNIYRTINVFATCNRVGSGDGGGGGRGGRGGP